MHYDITNLELLKRLLQEIPGDDSCMEWPGPVLPGKHPYGKMSINNRRRYVHRVAYELSYGNIPAGQQICHRCDNPRCFRPSHLFVGSGSENIQDSVKKGRRIGMNGKFTLSEIAEIRRLSESGVKQIHIASRFGVTQGHISNIVLRKTWRLAN